jgi:hypothetical protein
MPSNVQSRNQITLDTPSLTILGSEPVPEEIVQTLLMQAWIKTERVPMPLIKIMDSEVEQYHMSMGDLLLIEPADVSEKQHGFSYEYKDVFVTVPVAFKTMVSRQRLYDLWAEARRIVYEHMWAIRPYQQAYVDSFQSEGVGLHKLWSGVAMFRFTSLAVPIISGISTGFETPATPQAATPAAAFPQFPPANIEGTEEPLPPATNTSSDTF